MNILKIQYLVCCFIYMVSFCPLFIHAQSIKPGDTTYNKWKHSIVHLKSIYKEKNSPQITDTLTGTAFLITDNNKLYLVTTKHLIQSTLNGKNEATANDAIFIKDYLDVIKTGLNINSSINKDGKNTAIALTSDQEDIGIISLQKREYKDIATYLLTHGSQPIPIQLIDTSNRHYSNEWAFKYGYSIFKSKRGKSESVGMGTCQIDKYDPAEPFFTIKNTVIMPGNNGSPIVNNDKLIGILSNATGILTNEDIIKQPTYAIRSAKIIKASYILFCLRKLQKAEAKPTFDN